MISVLPVRRAQSKSGAFSSSGRLTAFSHSSQGFGGHDISILFERTATWISRPICWVQEIFKLQQVAAFFGNVFSLIWIL